MLSRRQFNKYVSGMPLIGILPFSISKNQPKQSDENQYFLYINRKSWDISNPDSKYNDDTGYWERDRSDTVVMANYLCDWIRTIKQGIERLLILSGFYKFPQTQSIKFRVFSLYDTIRTIIRLKIESFRIDKHWNTIKVKSTTSPNYKHGYIIDSIEYLCLPSMPNSWTILENDKNKIVKIICK